MHDHDRLARLVRESGLLDATQLAGLDRLRASVASVDELAGEVVRLGWLTPFQLRWVRRGKGRNLSMGHYVLLDRLGGGGMAQVFKARHRVLGRPAAVK